MSNFNSNTVSEAARRLPNHGPDDNTSEISGRRTEDSTTSQIGPLQDFPVKNAESDYYQHAFFRNIGLLTHLEQNRLRRACVAIPGMGAIGSAAAVALARIGIGKFRIADFDRYDIVNTPQQYGASAASIGLNKAEVMAETITAINPEVDIKIFTEPITDFNIDHFLSGANLVIDGLDFFVPDTRRLLYRKARDKNLHVIMPISLGFGVSLHTFSPTGMSFDRYFNIKSSMPVEEKIMTFITGLSPKRYYRHYISAESIDYVRKRLPSTGSSSHLAGGMAATEAINLLLKRQRVKAAPHYSNFDPYLRKYKSGYLIWGNRGPVQRLKLLRLRMRNGLKSFLKNISLWQEQLRQQFRAIMPDPGTAKRARPAKDKAMPIPRKN